MAVHLLIGPSGVGKTTACQLVSKKNIIKIYDLDKELKVRLDGGSVSNYLSQNGDENFFKFSKSTIEDIENDNTDAIIVIGAGSINWEPGHEWYASKKLITLIGDPEILYDRGNRQVHHPTLDSYLSTEFNSARLALYKRALVSIDVTLKSPQAVADMLIEIVKELD